jgi:hypothetical protein
MRDIETVLPHDFHTWAKEQQRSYLRHPQHRKRCACKQYGMLGLDVRDNWGQHSTWLCQPDREVIG